MIEKKIFRLAQVLEELQKPESKDFNLPNELRMLHTAREAGLSEAGVFHAGRILESLAASGLRRKGMRAASNLYSNIELLHEEGDLNQGLGMLAHLLRRMANDLRHVTRDVTPEEPLLAACISAIIIQWYLSRYVAPEAALLRDVTSICDGILEAQPLIQILVDPDAMGADLHRQDWKVVASSQPHIVCTVAEKLIDSRNYAEADHILAHLDPDKFDRSQELRALWFSRQGMLPEAMECISPLDESESETSGIKAGILKRLYRATGQTDALEQASMLYRASFTQTREQSVYLGVNAAACSFWLGNPDGARKISQPLLKRLGKRESRYSSENWINQDSRSYYEVASYAELLLLAGEYDRSLTWYRKILAPSLNRSLPVHVTAEQLSHHLSHLESHRHAFESIPALAEFLNSRPGRE